MSDSVGMFLENAWEGVWESTYRQGDGAYHVVTVSDGVALGRAEARSYIRARDTARELFRAKRALRRIIELDHPHSAEIAREALGE